MGWGSCRQPCWSPSCPMGRRDFRLPPTLTPLYLLGLRYFRLPGPSPSLPVPCHPSPAQPPHLGHLACTTQPCLGGTGLTAYSPSLLLQCGHVVLTALVTSPPPGCTSEDGIPGTNRQKPRLLGNWDTVRVPCSPG